MKIKKGDKIIVISGKDKGTKGSVLQTAPDSQKVLVEGVNIVKKHIKAEKTRKGKVGQRIELPAFIDISNVKLICSHCQKATRVGYDISSEKKKRICKRCGKAIDEK